MSLNYTEEELNLLANTPHIIGAAMAFVGNSGMFGTGKEMFVNAQAVMAGVKDYPDNALIQAILPNVQGGASVAMGKMKKVRDWGVERFKAKGVDSAQKFQAQMVEDCKEVNALLEAKASPQEATEYKQWAMSIAEKVAMAATEGGFLGFGGERFSANEKQLFSQIESAMGTQSLQA
ncbi:hypothetical protein MGMO_61c00180 [Methyloglobulus morosus KoM1]|uniref:Uncharacterized protein n=1 Tax=Methyloglobulus morosus KoM1 TaxID=1116472 RepID=V5C1F3_9GAMM|nr:hypothetical protein [Methyloglobulus morosus]ESS72307.1 hypothetical protein MGMO_61c00180 [Methyloglobulus morosus KoM1]